MKKLLFVAFIFLISATAFASTTGAAADAELATAQTQLIELRSSIQEISDSGFPVTRFTDEYSILRELYTTAFTLNDANQPIDLTLFFQRADSLKQTIAKAKEARDQLLALDQSIDAASKTLDVNAARELYNEAKQEFADQRYEIAVQDIDKAYTKLVELQGVQAQANAAYEATRKNVIGFVQDNWQIILIIIAIPTIIYLIFRNQITLSRINAKIEATEFEIGVLKDEIKDSQKSYFVDGKIPEDEYNIKVQMYSEKIRDLHSKLALYMEKKETLLRHTKGLNTKKR